MTVGLEDTEIFVEKVGAGGPMLICGGPQLGHAYMRDLDFLADTFELIYFDARGSGRSALGDPSKLTLTGAVADLEGVRAGLGVERCVILGHSLGGHVAYLYASIYPERVEGLVLVDVGPPFEPDQAMELHRQMTVRRTAEDDARLAQLQSSEPFERREPGAVEDFIRNIYGPFFRDPQAAAAFEYGFTEITAANVLDYEERLVASLPDRNPPARLAAIRCPTLVVHGEVDPIPVSFGRHLADSIPNARFAVIPGASHFPFVEDTDLFAATVRPFLAGLWT